MDDSGLKKTFVVSQVGAELLAWRTLSAAKGKGTNKKHLPHVEDLTRKYMDLYVKIGDTIEAIDNEE